MFRPNKLKQARISEGISQEKLLVKLSNSGLPLSRVTLSSWEGGDTQPNVDELLIIARCLNHQPEFFYTNEKVAEYAKGKSK